MLFINSVIFPLLLYFYAQFVFIIQIFKETSLSLKQIAIGNKVHVVHSGFYIQFHLAYRILVKS